MRNGVDGTETAEVLLRAAVAAGYSVSRDQLVRWHRTGLLPRPSTAGLGQGRGTVTLYTVGTSRQLIALCEIRKRYRRLDDAGWLLWWQGYAVPGRVVTRYVQKVASRYVDLWAKALTPEGTPTELMDELLDQAHEVRLGKTLGRVRRRVGSEEFERVLEAILAVAGGGADQLTDSEVALLEHATALDRGRVSTPGSPQGWISGDFRETIVACSKVLGPCNLAALAIESDMSALWQAASEVKSFARVILAFARLVAPVDRWAYGFGMLGTALEEMLEKPDSQAMAVLFLVAARAAGLGDGIDTITHLGKVADQIATMSAVLGAIRQEIPGAAEALPERLVAAAAIRPDRQAELAKRVGKLRADDPEAMDAVLARFPEIRT